MQIKPLFLCVGLAALAACNNPEAEKKETSNTAEKQIPLINYTSTKFYPHDTTAFTEGFLFHEGTLYESTGATPELSQTKSLFGSVDLSTGIINAKATLDRKKYFGEGIVFLNGRVFQLTYKTKIGFIYDAKTFKKLGEFTFPSEEGWGFTTDGQDLIMSDGTNVLTYLDPKTLQVKKTLAVAENGYAKDNLNELEFINGYIYANIWTSNIIVKIKPETGEIVAKIDLTPLAEDATRLYPGSLEMNGIAYNPSTDQILITGKLWPKIYELSFSH